MRAWLVTMNFYDGRVNLVFTVLAERIYNVCYKIMEMFGVDGPIYWITVAPNLNRPKNTMKDSGQDFSKDSYRFTVYQLEDKVTADLQSRDCGKRGQVNQSPGAEEKCEPVEGQ